MDNQFISSNRKVAFISIPGLHTLLTIPNTKRTSAGTEKLSAGREFSTPEILPEVQVGFQRFNNDPEGVWLNNEGKSDLWVRSDHYKI